MTPLDSAWLTVALLVAAIVASGWGWTRAGRLLWPPLAAVLLAGALAVAVHGRLGASEQALDAVVATAAAVLAVAGGGPVTSWVFAWIDRHDTTGAHTMRDAGSVLRGGAWIGGLERTAIVVSLLAGWPEGVALALALKGLGRYPELRNQDNPGTAERFIIGTFTSVLWAAGCAGVVLLLRA